jgi:ubiquitin-activating enzyme E1
MNSIVIVSIARFTQIKEPVHAHHKPLIQRLLKPKFSSTNGCLSPKQDRALSLSLVAAMQALDGLRSSTQPFEVFKILMLEKLKSMGIADPLLSTKKGGLVGSDWIQYVGNRIYEGGFDECPATVSVVGSMASQEVIKAITHMYMPASQFMLFESLDSIALNETSPRFRRSSVDHVYDRDVLEELTRMKVFIVGSGAIGCELLKTFALMGVGAGEVGLKSNEFRDSLISSPIDEVVERNSLWDELHLTNGGIIVTDNDNIERSNLNRQLLFR